MQKQILYMTVAILLFATMAFGQNRGGAIGDTGAGASGASFDLNYYALIIGINKYQGKIPPLATAVNDAKGVRDVLIDQYGFNKDNVVTLFDGQATRAGIIDNLRNFAKKLGERDSLFIYYAGHGELDNVTDAGNWIPVDGVAGRWETYLPNSTIRDYLRGIKARHILLVSDSCFSGSLLVERAMPSEINNRYYREAAKRPSRKVLTSGGMEPVADTGKSGHSIFSYYFIKALKDNSSPYIVPTEIFSSIKTPLTNNSQQTPIQGPLEGAGDEGGEFVFLNQNASSSTVISFLADAESNIYIDGAFIGTTPIHNLPVDPGERNWHLVCATLNQERTGTVQVENGKQEVVDVRFKTDVAYVTILTRPWCEIYVDGIKRGTSPMANLFLSPGPHQITLKNMELGYKKIIEVDLKKGQTKKIVEKFAKGS